MSKERLALDMTMMDVVMTMSEGNPGAVTACMELMKSTPVVDPDCLLGGVGHLMMLDNLHIYGPRLYMLWSDVCGRDIAKMIAVLRAYQLGQLAGAREDAINHAIDNRGEGLNVEAIVERVRAQLPNFNAVSA